MKAPEHTRYFANHGDKLPTEVAMAILGERQGGPRD
jgi:hypothetical protein